MERLVRHHPGEGGRRNAALLRLTVTPSRPRGNQPIAPVLELRGGDHPGHGASAIEAEAVMLEDMRIGIAGHCPVFLGWRVAMNDHQAVEAAAPFQKRFVDPGPVMAAEFR